MPTRKPRSNLEKNQRASAPSQKPKSMEYSELEPDQSDNLANDRSQAVETACPNIVPCESQSQDVPETKSIVSLPVKPEWQWLNHFQQHSQLLMAVVEPGTFTLQYANDYFCSLMGIGGTYSDIADREIRLPDLLPDFKGTAVDTLYRQHVLHLVLRDIYKIPVPSLRLRDHPVIVA